MKDFCIGDLEYPDHMLRYHPELMMESTKDDKLNIESVSTAELNSEPMEVKTVPNTRVKCIDQALRLLHPESKKSAMDWYIAFTNMSDADLNDVALMAESIYDSAKKGGL